VSVSSTASVAAPAARDDRFPPQIKYIVGNEACERFSFYGMKSILTIFMVSHYAMPDNQAESTYHLFVSASYLFPILGAWVSDRFWGKYRTIMNLSIVYCLGHAVLALWDARAGMYLGLSLIALGSGGIKPCVSAHVGDQFTAKNEHLLAKIFDVFYFSVNFGSFFSTLLIPWVLPHFGPAWAFGIPGILMAIATVVFWIGRNQYVHVPPTGKTGEKGFLPVFWRALTNQSALKPGQTFYDAALDRFTPSEVEAAKAASAVFVLFVAVSGFWALYDQYGSSWVLQGEAMNRVLFGYKIEASQMAALNPILIMILIPLFAKLVYPAARRLGLEPTPLRRMSVGMFVAAASFAAAMILQLALDAGRTPSIAWQFVPYLLLSVGEIMVSITGLEFAYTQAPRSMKSTIMSFWLLTIFAGNLLTAYISEINKFHGAAYFGFFVGLMVALSFVFVWIASRYKVRSYLESAEPSALADSAAAA
jgi:POT family proton-dependent oligopeptide transporter